MSGLLLPSPACGRGAAAFTLSLSPQGRGNLRRRA